MQPAMQVKTRSISYLDNFDMHSNRYVVALACCANSTGFAHASNFALNATEMR